MKTRKLTVWGLDIRPKLPWGVKVGQLFQLWRNSIVVEELLFLVCSECKKEFSIFAEFCQKNVYCPYCGSVARFVENSPGFLSCVCISSLKRRGVVDKG